MRRLILFSLALCLCIAPAVSAQDAVKADPKHYSVLIENEQVRILKVHYGPGEKSVMHSHPAAVAVFNSNSTGKFTYPDGKSEVMTTKMGDARYMPGVTHMPENTGTTALDVIVVELKSKAHAQQAEKAAAKTPKK